ncbi:hypothetical protein [Nocardia sp. X0981]
MTNRLSGPASQQMSSPIHSRSPGEAAERLRGRGFHGDAGVFASGDPRGRGSIDDAGCGGDSAEVVGLEETGRAAPGDGEYRVDGPPLAHLVDQCLPALGCGQVGLDIGVTEVAADDLGASLAQDGRGGGTDARCGAGYDIPTPGGLCAVPSAGGPRRLLVRAAYW